MLSRMNSTAVVTSDGTAAAQNSCCGTAPYAEIIELARALRTIGEAALLSGDHHTAAREQLASV